MFRADQLTASRRQRQQVGQLRAQSTQQETDNPAGSSPDQAREMRTGQNTRRMSKMQEKLQAKMLSVLLIAT